MSNIKLGAIIFLIVFLVGAIKFAYNAVYDAGYNDALAKNAELVKKANDAFDIEIKKALEDKKNANAEAARLLEELNNAEGKFREIQKATANSDCKSLGPESFKLFNEIIGPKPQY